MAKDAETVILSACRTPIGAFGGAFKDLSAADLGAVAVRGAIARAAVAPAEIGDVIIGCVLQAGAGMNVARQAALKADSKAFALAWGPNGESNAFGKCVSTTASGKSTSQQQATVSAAKFCLAAEKTAGLSSFMTTYGTFGHCVSLKASGK